MKRVIGLFAAILILSLPARALQHPEGKAIRAEAAYNQRLGTYAHVQYFGQ